MKFSKPLDITLVSKLVIALLLLSSQLSTQAFALDQIINPFFTTREAGMGGVRYLTGFYEENFYANPARATANPTWRLTLLDFTAEANDHLDSFVKSATASGDKVQALGDSAGNNNHARVETAMPALYISKKQTGRMSYGIAFLTNSQADFAIRNSGNIDPDAIFDIGPALTVARSFLDNENLNIGATAHYTYRLASNTNYNFISLIQGKSISASQNGGDGTMLSFDLGTTYSFPWEPAGVKLSVGGAVNNITAAKYTSTLSVLKNGVLPPNQPRNGGAGISAERPSIGILGDTVFAIELSDIGNNPNGSFWRLTHWGAETHLTSVFALRGGFNQGYISAGLGIDLKIISIDFATYGEEMALNSGEEQDRRYAVKFAIHI